jgi:sugar transferase (PEP-CTERM/EpsH1 system associated)
MQVLFLSRWRPFPPDNGSKLRIFNLLRQLSQQHELRLIAFDDDMQDTPTVGPLRDICASVQFVPYRTFRPYSGRALAGGLALSPRFLVDTYSPQLSRLVAETVTDHRPDVIVASQLDMAPYALQTDGIPLVLEELEVSTHLDAYKRGTLRQRARSALTWYKLAAYLRRALPRFAACTVVSDLEAANVHQASPAYDRVEVVPNAIDLDQYRGDFGATEPETLVFSGALTYRPNLDAALFFLDAIYPEIRTRVPGVRLRITGRQPDSLPRFLLDEPGVELTGYLPDIRPTIARSCVSVVPLRSGGGTRLKILEAMALGTPVVSTKKGAEGLDATPGLHLLVADEPAAFADAVVQLLQSPIQRRQLADQAHQLVRSRYEWNAIGARFQGVVQEARRSQWVLA